MKIGVNDKGEVQDVIFDSQTEADDYFEEELDRLDVWYRAKVREAKYLKHAGLLQRTNERAEKWRKELEEYRAKVKVIKQTETA